MCVCKFSVLFVAVFCFVCVCVCLSSLKWWKMLNPIAMQPIWLLSFTEFEQNLNMIAKKWHKRKKQWSEYKNIQTHAYELSLNTCMNKKFGRSENKRELIKIIFDVVHFISKRTGTYYVNYSGYDSFYWALPPSPQPHQHHDHNHQ